MGCLCPLLEMGGGAPSMYRPWTRNVGILCLSPHWLPLPTRPQASLSWPWLGRFGSCILLGSDKPSLLSTNFYALSEESPALTPSARVSWAPEASGVRGSLGGPSSTYTEDREHVGGAGMGGIYGPGSPDSWHRWSLRQWPVVCNIA